MSSRAEVSVTSLLSAIEALHFNAVFYTPTWARDVGCICLKGFPVATGYDLCLLRN
jgi:hypothetical protein